MPSSFPSFVLFRFAVLFESLGFQHGDVIHLCIGNHNLTLPLSFGAWILGGVVSVGDVNLEPRGVAGQLNDTAAKIVFCTPDTSNLVKAAVAKSEQGSKVKAFCLGRSAGEWCEDVYGALEGVGADHCPTPYTPLRPKKEPCVIFWSSGTTGKKLNWARK